MNARFTGTYADPFNLLEVLSSNFAPAIAAGRFALLDEFADTYHPSNSNYPPYNASLKDKDTLVLEFALAGFSKDDIKVSLLENKLRVETKTQSSTTPEPDTKPKSSNKKEAEAQYPYYFKKAVAMRDFSLQFTIPKDFKVNDPKMVDGMLTIIATRVKVETPEAYTFNIK